MKLTDAFLSQLAAEGPRTRRVLEQLPAGRDDWRPHARSMPLGQLARLVARMPSWLALVIENDHWDFAEAADRRGADPAADAPGDCLTLLEHSMARAHAAIGGTTEEHLMGRWPLRVDGTLVNEVPRHVMLRDTFMHLAHHRGQLTVYLRLRGAKVPAIYGPSADDERFG